MGEESAAVWSRLGDDDGNHVWRGVDLARPSDSSLMSPSFAVSETEPFTVRFRHRYEFERADEERGVVYYDGAVIEVTTDDGLSWQDVSDWVDPGYGGLIDNTSGNPLADRQGFVDHNPSWPGYDEAQLDFGTAFAGQAIRLRFHIGTDQAAGKSGWYLDDFAFGGVVNTPFATVAESVSACGSYPQLDGGADAGADAAPAPDAGAAGLGGGGCGCVVAAPARGGLIPALLVGTALLGARRRRPRP
jgi:hypothetical protein